MRQEDIEKLAQVLGRSMGLKLSAINKDISDVLDLVEDLQDRLSAMEERLLAIEQELDSED